MDHKYSIVFSPIAMTHGMVEFRPQATSWEHWRANDLGLLRKADDLFILTLDGWEESVGMREENKVANAYGIRINQIIPRDDGYIVWRDCGPKKA